MSGPWRDIVGASQFAGVIIDGDSLMARTWNEQPITSASRSGTTATITFNGHSVPQGSDVIVHGYADPLWNGIKTVTGIATNTFTFDISSSAESSPTTGLHTPTFIVRAHRRHDSYYTWAEMVSGKDYNLVYNHARGARKLAEMATDFASTVALSQTGGVYILQGGTNDANQAESLATSEAAIESIIRQAQARGLKVILSTVPPFTGAVNTTARANAVLALNKSIRKFARTYRCQLLDVYAIVVDPASAAADARSGYLDSSDSVHLTPTACRLIGPELYPMLDRAGLGLPIAIPATTGDLSTTLASASNVLDGFFAGTGGSTAGGATGSVASGWTLTNSSIGTCTASKGTASVGASQIVTVNGSSGSYNLAGPSLTSSFSAGDVIRLVGKVSCTMDAAYRMTIGLSLTNGGVNSEIRSISSPLATLPMPSGTYEFTFQSEPFTIPSGVTYTKFRPEVVCVLTGSTTTALEFEQFAVRKVA